TVQFSSPTYSIAENGGVATIEVKLSDVATGKVTVNFSTSDGTATEDSDYTGAYGTLEFNAGDKSKTFTVPILDDNIPELNETVNLTLSAPSGATLGMNSTAVLTIIDDDAPGTFVVFAAPKYYVMENSPQATILVML